MQSTIIPDLDTAIKKFVKKSIFSRLEDIITFLKQESNTFYRYDPDDESLAANPLPPIVQDRKNEILKSSIKSEAPLEESDLDEMSESDIEQDEKEKKWNDQAAEKEAWKAILKTRNEDSKKTYKQLLTQILSNESYEVKKAIAKNFDIAYKTLRLHDSNLTPQQNDNLEEAKEGASQTLIHQREIDLDYLLQGSPDKNSMQTILGSQPQTQGVASIISGILVKRKAPEGNKLDQGKLNLEETSIQTTFGDQGERPRVTLQQEASKDKNQEDDEKKRNKKHTLKDELNKRMQDKHR